MLELLDKLLIGFEQLRRIHEGSQLEDALLLLLVDAVVLSDFVCEFIVRESSGVQLIQTSQLLLQLLNYSELREGGSYCRDRGKLLPSWTALASPLGLRGACPCRGCLSG